MSQCINMNNLSYNQIVYTVLDKEVILMQTSLLQDVLFDFQSWKNQSYLQPYSYNIRKYFNSYILAEYILMLDTSYSNQSANYAKVDVWNYATIPPTIVQSLDKHIYTQAEYVVDLFIDNQNLRACTFTTCQYYFASVGQKSTAIQIPIKEFSSVPFSLQFWMLPFVYQKRSTTTPTILNQSIISLYNPSITTEIIELEIDNETNLNILARIGRVNGRISQSPAININSFIQLQKWCHFGIVADEQQRQKIVKFYYNSSLTKSISTTTIALNSFTNLVLGGGEVQLNTSQLSFAFKQLRLWKGDLSSNFEFYSLQTPSQYKYSNLHFYYPISQNTTTITGQLYNRISQQFDVDISMMKRLTNMASYTTLSSPILVDTVNSPPFIKSPQIEPQSRLKQFVQRKYQQYRYLRINQGGSIKFTLPKLSYQSKGWILAMWFKLLGSINGSGEYDILIHQKYGTIVSQIGSDIKLYLQGKSIDPNYFSTRIADLDFDCRKEWCFGLYSQSYISNKARFFINQIEIQFDFRTKFNLQSQDTEYFLKIRNGSSDQPPIAIANIQYQQLINQLTSPSKLKSEEFNNVLFGDILNFVTNKGRIMSLTSNQIAYQTNFSYIEFFDSISQSICPSILIKQFSGNCQYNQKIISLTTSQKIDFPLGNIDFAKLPDGYTLRFWDQPHTASTFDYNFQHYLHFVIGQKVGRFEVYLYNPVNGSMALEATISTPTTKPVRWYRHAFIFNRITKKILYISDSSPSALQFVPVSNTQLSVLTTGTGTNLSLSVDDDGQKFHSIQIFNQPISTSWAIYNSYNDMSGSEGNLLSLWMVDQGKIIDKIQGAVVTANYFVSITQQDQLFCVRKTTGSRRRILTYCQGEQERSLVLAPSTFVQFTAVNDSLLGDAASIVLWVRLQGNTQPTSTLQNIFALGSNFITSVDSKELLLEVNFVNKLTKIQTKQKIQMNKWQLISITIGSGAMNIYLNQTTMLSNQAVPTALQLGNPLGTVILSSPRFTTASSFKDVFISPFKLSLPSILLLQNQDKTQQLHWHSRFYTPLFESSGGILVNYSIYEQNIAIFATISKAHFQLQAEKTLRTCQTGRVYILDTGCVSSNSALTLSNQSTSFSTTSVDLQKIDGTITLAFWWNQDTVITYTGLSQTLVATSGKEVVVFFQNQNLSDKGAVGVKILKKSSLQQKTLGGVANSSNENRTWNYTTVGVRVLSNASQKQIFIGKAGNKILTQTTTQSLQVQSIQHSTSSIIVGNQVTAVKGVNIGFSIRQLRLWKAYIHPKIAYQEYSRNSEQISSGYWKLFPLYYLNSKGYEYNSGSTFDVQPLISYVQTPDVVVCRDDTFSSDAAPKYCQKKQPNFVKITNQFTGSIDLTKLKSSARPYDFTYMTWFQSNGSQPKTLNFNVAISDMATIKINSDGEVEMIHKNGQFLHQAQSLRTLTVGSYANKWIAVSLSGKEGIQFNSNVRSSDSTLNQSESKTVSSYSSSKSMIDSIGLQNNFSQTNPQVYLRNMLVLDYSVSKDSIAELSQTNIQGAYSKGGIVYIPFTSFSSNQFTNTANPDSSLIVNSTGFLPTFVSNTNDSTGDLVFSCQIQGLVSNGSKCSSSQQKNLNCNAESLCSQNGIQINCPVGTLLYESPPVCVTKCPSTTIQSSNTCIKPICQANYKSNEQICNLNPTQNQVKLQVQSGNSGLILKFSSLTTLLKKTLTSDDLQIQVDGAFSDYNFTWSFIQPEYMTSLQFFFNFSITNTLSGGGREKVILKIKNSELFKSLDLLPLSQTSVKGSLFAQVSKQYASQIQATKTLDTATSGVVSAVVAEQFGIAFASGISLQFLWGILNFLQVFQFLMLIDARYPKNFLQFKSVSETANFQFKIIEQSPNIITVMVNQDEIQDKPLNQNFESEQFESSIFTNVHRNGTNIALLFLIAWPFCVLGKFLCTKTYEKKKKCKCAFCIGKIDSIFSFNGFYRFFLQLYFEMAICAFISTTNYTFRNTSEIIVSIHGIVALFLVAFFPIYSYIYLAIKGKQFKNRQFKQKREALIQDLKSVQQDNSTRIRFKVHYYYPLFLLKRILMAALLVFIRNYPIYQLSFLLFVVILSLILTIIFKPFEDKTRNITEIIQDSIFTFVYLTLLVITLVPVKQSTSFLVGWLLILVPLTSIVFSIILILRASVITIKELCEKCKKRKKVDLNQTVEISKIRRLNSGSDVSMDEPEEEQIPPNRISRATTHHYLNDETNMTAIDITQQDRFESLERHKSLELQKDEQMPQIEDL